MTLRFVSKKLAKTNWTCFSQNLVVVPSIAPHRRQGTFLETPLAPYPKPESTWPPAFAKCLPPQKSLLQDGFALHNGLLDGFELLTTNIRTCILYTIYCVRVFAYQANKKYNRMSPYRAVRDKHQHKHKYVFINIYIYIHKYTYGQQCKKSQASARVLGFSRTQARTFLLDLLLSILDSGAHSPPQGRTIFAIQLRGGNGKTWWVVAGPVEMTKCPT